MNNSSSRLLVAIDFGTSHSGFAYCHKGNPTEIEACYIWDDAPHPYSKNLSALLYDENKALVDWGYSAHHAYLAVKGNRRSLHTYVTNCKLFLDESYHKKPPAGFNAIELIGDLLKSIKAKLIEMLITKFGSTVSLKDVQWCLTVPAMWSDRAKNHTRKAAVLAGIIDDPLSTKLSIILEPEAAAIYVARNKKGEIEKGDVFMVVDAGGGTVDLIVQQVVEEISNEKFVEVVPGIGKSCGSAFVDDRFFKFFREKVGPDAFEKWKRDRPTEILHLNKFWEPIKRAFTGKDLKEEMYVPIPNALYKLMSNERKSFLEETQDGFDDCVLLTTKDMFSFFDSIVEEVLKLIDTMLQKSTLKVDKILCVGGFSDSKYLLCRVREKHEKNGIKVFCPPDPGATVVKGAVHYGLQPEIISTRRSRRTYGIDSNCEWDNKYPVDSRYWSNYRKEWIVDIFSKFVEIGEELKVDQIVKHTYFPFSPFQSYVRVTLYATSSKSPQFTSDEGCCKLGEINIPIEMTTNMDPDNYALIVSLQFGTTEIKVNVDDTVLKKQHDLNVNYDI